MIKDVMERLEGINPRNLIRELVDLVEAAEKLGDYCQVYLYEDGSKEKLKTANEEWQDLSDRFYDKFVR